MQKLTAAEVERFLCEVGSDLRQAGEHLRFLAGGAGGAYRVSEGQRRQLEHAAALLDLSREAALSAGAG